MIIGVTGNSGTGKSSICKDLARINKNQTTTILDADQIAKEISVPGNEYFNKIIGFFGEKIVTNDGLLNRKKLSDIIFEDAKKREELDSLTFKYVVEEIKNRLFTLESDVVIIDAPLLIESGLNKICDVVISVIANEKIKLERICNRDNLDKDTAKLRLNSQKENDFYINNSNYVIVNNDADLEEQAGDLLEFINSKYVNDNIVIVQDKNLKILQFKELLKFKELKHAFTLKPLDFGSNNSFNEKENEVKNNYKTLCDYLKIDSKNIVRVYQTHTNNVAIIKDEKGIFPKELIDIDGLITDEKDKILSLVFADCTPIFMYDPKKQIIANVHSGWQGTLKMIAKEAVEKMIQKFDCNAKDIICAIGPTIRKCHFEVEEDIKNEFVERFKKICNAEQFVAKKELEEKYYIDTVMLNKTMLLNSGVSKENIIDSDFCTVCNSNLTHSYRADKENSGRSTAIIFLK